MGAFARLCLLNVDSLTKIGPLVDLAQGPVSGSSVVLTNYIQVFGTGTTSYLSRLGRAIQMSPTSTYPIRTYDPKVLLLLQCNSGGNARRLRRGRQWINTHLVKATDTFFQCMLIEILRVEVLVEWSLCFNGSDVSRLPGILDIPSLLDFTDAVLRKRGVSSTKSVIQEQYQINDNFKDRQIFRSFFEHLQKELPSWLARQVDRDICDSQHLFSETNKLLTKFVNNGIVDSYHTQPLHCQHMLLNFNEVVDQFPFGAPVTPVVGFGGNFGAQLLQDKEFKSNDPVMVRNVMSNLLDNYSSRSKSDLLLLGLKKTSDGKGVSVIINGRPLGVCDPEHGCCIQYPVLERERAEGPRA